jgi:hypothetical protein
MEATCETESFDRMNFQKQSIVPGNKKGHSNWISSTNFHKPLLYIITNFRPLNKMPHDDIMKKISVFPCN